MLKTRLTIQKNRSQALTAFDKYNTTVILKGHETLIGNKNFVLCKKGNTVAVGGMGDAFWLVSGLIAQGLSAECLLGVDMHASAADSYIQKAMKSLMPSDLFNFIK